MSANPERHSRYGIDDSSTVITIRTTDGAEKSFTVGKSDMDRRSSFYRASGEDLIYSGTLFPHLEIPLNTEQWIIIPEAEDAE
jgi:hypothetical protein